MIVGAGVNPVFFIFVIPESAEGGYPESREKKLSGYPFDFAQGGEPVEPWISSGMTNV
jgi:hypothetical protein